MSKALETFGKYLLLERLAAGGMAEVYLAKSVGAGGIGKFVAIKRILPQYSDNEEFISMFKEEAKLVMNLNHGNIVSIFDFGIEHSQFFLVMEFVEGQNLRQVLNHMKKIGKYFSIDQIVHVAKEVASGLDHANRCMDASTGRLLNITHRDMSPQNVMLSFEGEVKVVDFGIAKAENQIEQTQVGTIKGKFGYMSPEQAEGQSVDARTDIFSLGIVLWELLAKDRLFTAQNEQAVLKKIKECQIPPIRQLNPAVQPELEKILLKALTRDRNLRYQSAENFAKDLSKYLNTNFPDFSKQEFSKFMKQVYSDMYQENRKKLAEYAKVEVELEGNTDHASITTSYTNEQINANLKNKITAAKNKKSEENDSEDDRKDENSLQIDQSLSHKVDLSKLIVEDGIKSYGGIVSQSKKNQYLANVTTGQYINTQHRSGGTQVNYNPGTGTNIRWNPPQEFKKSNSNWLATLLIAVAIAIGGYYFLQNRRAHSHSGIYAAIPNETTQGLSEYSSKTPAQQSVSLNIQSIPSGAKVIINDIPIGVTPVISHVDQGKPFKLALFRDGYLPAEFVSEVAEKDGYSRNVVMMPEPSTGTIVINTSSQTGQNTIVKINGQRVANQLPYVAKVAAGTPVTVTLINPYLRTQGQVTVVIKQNQKRNLDVPLNKPATITE